jgi:hypothetical protein
MNGRIVSIDTARWDRAVMEGPPEELRERTPPHSLEAERSLLGALMTFPDVMERCSDVVVESDFFLHQHRVIFAAIQRLTNAGAGCDMVSVFEALREAGQEDAAGGLAFLNDVAEAAIGERSSVRQHASIVAERAMQRRLIELSDQIAMSAYSPNGRTASDLLDEVSARLVRLNEQRRNPGRRIPILSLSELKQSAASVRWLVKHVIPAESIGMLFGGSGTFKSFVALDAALHVARGMPWMGRKTRQGPVLYIAAEGGAGIWQRINAWHRSRRLRTADTPLRVVPVAVDLSVDAWRVVDAAQALGIVPSLIVVDTLSQTYGGEENSANEMAAYLREIGNRFRALWACAVLLLHHSGHAATERPRGSSAIRANVDFLLGLHRDEKEMLATLSCAKQKDGDQFQDATFALAKQSLGTDEDGEEVDSLVARHLSSADEVSEAMQAEAQAGRGGKNHQFMSLVQNGMKASDLRKLFGDECAGMSEEARRQAWHRAKSWAISKGYIEIAQGIVITTKPKGAA